MYEGFDPELLAQARHNAAVHYRGDVLRALRELIVQWKASNRPTLIGDFRPLSARIAYDRLNRVRA